MKPKIPDHVDVGPYCYTITVDELARHRAQESAQTILLGHTNHDDLTVIINEKMSASLARETLLHEMLHTVNEVTGKSESSDAPHRSSSNSCGATQGSSPT